MRPTSCAVAPDTAEDRRASIDALGRRIWASLHDGEPERMLADDLDLRTLLEADAATRVEAQRRDVEQRIEAAGDLSRSFGSAAYAGLCIQGARLEHAPSVLGLRSDAWVFDRVLIIGRRPTGQRIAAWVEGLFVYSDAGWSAIDLERLERPRWEHSDLEIAPCDLSIRDDLPEPAR